MTIPRGKEACREDSVLIIPSFRFRGETTDNWQNPDSTAGIIVGSVTAGLVVVTGLFLLTAYCMRTRALERRVKAMDTLAVDTATEEKTGKPWAPATVQDIPGHESVFRDFQHKYSFR